MAKPEWGTKRTCLSCGEKFYDLQRDPVNCPSCETRFDPEAAIRLKRGRTVVAEAKPTKEAASDDVELLDTDDDALEDAGDDVLEDTSDLDGDDNVGVVAPTSGDNDDS